MSISALSKRSRSRGGAYSVDFTLPSTPAPDLDEVAANLESGVRLPEFLGKNSTRMSCYSPSGKKTPKEMDRPSARSSGKTFQGLDGYGYNLAEDEAQYRMPNEKSLPPAQDTESGHLDMWPSRPKSQGSTRQNSGKDPRGNTTLYKPKFLIQLESYIEHEKHVLGCKDDFIGSEKRLQIYREVFKFIVNDFKTYKPILATIKHEYEEHIRLLQDKIGVASGLKAQLAVINQQHEREIAQARDEHMQETKKYQEDNKSLYQFIHSFKDTEKQLMIQVKKLSNELSEEHARFCEQSDMKKMLLGKVRELEKFKDEKKAEIRDLESDHLKVKIMLRKAQNDLKTAKEEIATYKERFVEVVPRYNYDLLEESAEEAKKNMMIAEQKYETQRSGYEKLQKDHAEVKSQRDQLLREKQRMKRVGTPRPDWDRVSEFLTGSANRWRKLSEGKTSQEKMELVCKELRVMTDQLSGKVLIQKSEDGMFEPLGTEPYIPKYLRTNAKVNNKNIKKRDCEMMIKDIWKEKAVYDSMGKKREQMDNYLYTYLQKKFGAFPNVIVEAAYNLVNGCQMYDYDADVELFYKVLTGELDEEVYHDQMNMVSKVETLFVKLDSKLNNGVLKGKLSKSDILEALKLYFPTKTDEQWEEVEEALDEDVSEDIVEYSALFAEDREGNQGEFAEAMRDQHVQERLKYASDIQKAMTEIIDNEDEVISIEETRQAILTADPFKTEKEIDNYISRGFGSPIAKLHENEVVKISIFIKRLQAGLLKRSVQKGIDKLKNAAKKGADAGNMFAKVVSMAKGKKK
eukprot:Nk52_evm61s221 gene=Nk52_evmTU61s221